MTKLLTPDEVAALLKVKKATIYSWTHLKQIPHVKVGSLVRFHEEEVLSWLDRKRQSEEEIPTIDI